MATEGRPPSAPVAGELFRDARRFDFFQAVRLLAWLYPDRPLPGHAGNPRQESVRYRSRLRLEFPEGDLARVTPPRLPGEPAEMTVDMMRLGGARGPLPLWITELALDRLDERDPALADFLDIFHHRLVALFHRARSKHRPALAWQSPHETPAARAVYSFLGLGTPALRDRLETPDRSLLPFAGLVPPGPRSEAGLERLLSGVLRVPVEVTPFMGRWHHLDPAQHTKIGVTGQNQLLGRGALLGTRGWDRQAGARIRVGPVGYRTFLDLLPIGRRFRALESLARVYVRDELDFSLNLVLAGREVPRLELGAASESVLGWNARLLPPAPPQPDQPGGAPRGALKLGTTPGARLGWTSWLVTEPRSEAPPEQPFTDDDQVKLTLYRAPEETDAGDDNG